MERNKRYAPVGDRTFAALVRTFLASPKFTGDDWAPSTKELWSRYLNFAARPNCLGAVSLDDLRPSLVQAYCDGLAGRPGTQACSLSAIKILEKWAIVRDLLPRPITTGVETEKSQGGHTPWSEEHVELAEKHARPDLARVVTLGAHTGQRCGDLIRLGWTDIETYKGQAGLRVTQQKTGREVWIPITGGLATAMQDWERKPGPFLTRPDGLPWQRPMLTDTWVRHRNSNRALELLKRDGLVLHGLRGHACVRLLRIGATTRQIADWVGMSEPMVKNYTKFSDQRENALATVVLLSDHKSRAKVG